LEAGREATASGVGATTKLTVDDKAAWVSLCASCVSYARRSA